MGLFDMFAKKETDEQTVERLAKNAGNIVEMLKDTLRGPNGVDMKFPLLYAAGLAGHACLEAVKAERGTFQVATAKNGKRFYFGDDLNHYLLEDKYSVFSFCNAVSHNETEEILAIVKDTAMKVGGDELLIWGMPADSVYPKIKDCWDGIFINMTNRYCRRPSEWPVLYSIVLQNVILQAISAGAKDQEAGRMAMEVAIVIAKMDDDSI